jgi:oxygen-independent coproporphyrinogen-3 oxidase
MNRAHNSNEALNAVKYAQDNGFENISIDLIYGTPSLTEHQWRNNLQIAFALNVQHISAYCLTVEPKTALAQAVRSGKIKDVDEYQSAAHFEIMLDAMDKNNFVQYEISNFCKEGFYSKHNSNYWLKENYLGLGPSAHSYNGKSRQWNVSNNNLYIQSLDKNEIKCESEELAVSQRYNEYVLTSLRTMWGTSLAFIQDNFGEEYAAFSKKESKKYISSNDLILEHNNLFLTDKGKLLADKIASDMFKV